jgi:predicted DNA-binding protein (MmcQ/YjbR family)
MDRDELRRACAALKGAREDFPFGPDVSVYKVMDKVFALIPTSGSVSISLKCDPLRAVMLRESYPAITPGYHLNKQHWNTVECDGSVPDEEIDDLIEHSYDLIVGALTKKQKQELETL